MNEIGRRRGREGQSLAYFFSFIHLSSWMQPSHFHCQQSVGHFSPAYLILKQLSENCCDAAAFSLEGLTFTVYSIIIRDPHSGESLACWVQFFFQVDGSILVRNPFSYEHLSQCVHYSWRPITPDRRSWVPRIERQRETGLCWPLSPLGTRCWLSLCSDFTVWLKSF